jgi:hypothetical protein
MSNRFFKPYVGSDYKSGIYNGKKLLTLGVSHYCSYNDSSKICNCHFFNECTKNSSLYNEICPYYNDKPRVLLEDSSIDEIQNYIDGDGNPSYNNYFGFLMEYFNISNKNVLCNHIAFANYVQNFLNSTTTPQQTKHDIRNFEAFLETIDELQPDIIIIWGTKITDHFKKRYIQNIVQKLYIGENTYFWYLTYKDNEYTIINPYHPCDYKKHWSSHIDSFKDALNCYFSLSQD